MNLLIVSDIHLCRLRPGGLEGGQRELAAFLDWHADHPEGGVPWRLVINGDLCDLDYQADSVVDRGREEASVRMFLEVAREYPDVFGALARFLDRGHEVVLIPGNHDLDFVWPGVRAALYAELAAHGASDEALGRLSFRDWFYYEPGRVYIEHGHQYETDTVVVGPLDPFDGARLRYSLSTHWVSGYCPLIPELAYQVDHTKSFVHYLPLLLRFGLRAPAIFFRYLAFTLRTLADGGARHAVPTPRHLARRAELARELGLDEAVLERLERHTATPRMASRLAIAARLHALPAFLLPVALGLGAAAPVAASPPLLWLGLGILIVAFASTLLLSRSYAKVHASERTVAGELQRLLDVPLVCFGHFHVALDEPAGSGRYLNSGTWMEPALARTYIAVRGGDAQVRAWGPPRAGFLP